MNVTPQVWGITIAVIVGLFAFDLVVNARSPHAPTFRQSAAWSAVYLSLAVIFGLVVLWIWGGTYAGEYYAGFITEWALSVDNLFVFTIIMSSFAVPREHQQKVLLIGILMALVMRAIFIALGAAAINRFSWVFYLFGIFLIWTAIGLARGTGHEREHEEERENRMVSSGSPAVSAARIRFSMLAGSSCCLKPVCRGDGAGAAGAAAHIG